MKPSHSPSPFIGTLLTQAGYGNRSQNEYEQGLPSTIENGSNYNDLIRRYILDTENPLVGLFQDARRKEIPADKLPQVLSDLSHRIYALGQFPNHPKKAENLLKFAGFKSATTYDDIHRNSTYRFLHENGPNELVHYLIRQGYFEDAQVYVDAGCGNGRDVLAVKECTQTTECIGIDSAPTAITHARAQAAERKIDNGVAFVRGDTRRLLDNQSDLSGRVDVITFDSVLHLLTEPEARNILCTVRNKVLAPNGIIAISQKTTQCAINSAGNGSIVLTQSPGSSVRLCHDQITRRFDDEPALIQWIEGLGLRIEHHEVRRLQYASNEPDEFAWIIARNSQ